MKPTGKTHPITGSQIMEVERSDIPWRKTWEELTVLDKSYFRSYMKISLSNEEFELIVRQHYINQREAARADLLF